MYHARFKASTDGLRWQPLREHLLLVGRQAARYARLAAPNDPEFIRAARRAGLLHDLGKYGDEFQERLREKAAGRPARKAPHAVFGAGALGDESWDQALAVLGHHTGLHAVSEFKDKVRDEHSTSARALLERARGDVAPGPRRKCVHIIGHLGPAAPGARKADILKLELRQRMLFSCLVDADRSDSAHFVGENPPAPALEAASLLPRLLTFIAGKAANCPPGAVKECRAEVLKACLEVAGRPERLFTLPVPTGGGKTLSAMAFALRRAELRPGEVRRVIVVEPYLSIIEQNGAEYRKALGEGAVLEHHSGDFAGLSTIPREQSRTASPEDAKSVAFTENEGDAYRPDEEDEDANLGNLSPLPNLARENWDAPVIVTTSVRFFETIFSNRPADLRRLHNIARSVVILDEVQTLPPHLLAPLLSVMEGLSQDWGVHFVFATATQPAFERHAAAADDDRRWPPGTLTPIIPDALQERLVRDLKRVAEPAWPRRGETWSLERQAEAVLAEPRASTSPHALKSGASIPAHC
jgi:CRISPR-associated endonuclease/helicase Cas3